MITLTGAGFSKNFGLPLASDIGLQAGGILMAAGQSDVAAKLLAGDNFEDLLESYLNQEEPKPYARLREASVRCLEAMDERLVNRL